MVPSAVLMRSSSSSELAMNSAKSFCGVAHVKMQRQVVGVVLQVFEHRAVPAGPIRIGAEVGAPGGDQLDVGVGPLHQLGGFQGELAVVFGAAVAHLPGAVHLVAQAPIGHFPGLLRGRSACAAASWRCLPRSCSTPPTAAPLPTCPCPGWRRGTARCPAFRHTSETRACRSDCSPRVPQAISRRGGRRSRGPMPSFQW